MNGREQGSCLDSIGSCVESHFANVKAGMKIRRLAGKTSRSKNVRRTRMTMPVVNRPASERKKLVEVDEMERRNRRNLPSEETSD